MSVYNCNECEYSTRKKSCMIFHVNKTKSCSKFLDPVDNSILPEDKRYTHIKKKSIKVCSFCEKEFSTSSNRTKHEKKCTKKEKMEKEAKEKEAREKEAKEKEAKIINITNNNSIINNVTINITLSSYDDPAIPTALRCQLERYLKSLVGKPMEDMATLCFPGVFSLIYFNEDVPENHTISYNNKKDSTLKVYNGKEFMPIHKNEFKTKIEDILENKINRITFELGGNTDRFYDKHYKLRNSQEKEKEFELYLERANMHKKMVKTIKQSSF